MGGWPRRAFHVLSSALLFAHSFTQLSTTVALRLSSPPVNTVHTAKAHFFENANGEAGKLGMNQVVSAHCADLYFHEAGRLGNCQAIVTFAATSPLFPVAVHACPSVIVR